MTIRFEQVKVGEIFHFGKYVLIKLPDFISCKTLYNAIEIYTQCPFDFSDDDYVVLE